MDAQLNDLRKFTVPESVYVAYSALEGAFDLPPRSEMLHPAVTVLAGFFTTAAVAYEDFVSERRQAAQAGLLGTGEAIDRSIDAASRVVGTAGAIGTMAVTLAAQKYGGYAEAASSALTWLAASLSVRPMAIFYRRDK